MYCNTNKMETDNSSEIDTFHYHSINKTIKPLKTHINSIWSGYHKDYTPLTGNPKGIIFRINEDRKTITILSNSLNNPFDDTLNLSDMYVVFKLN